MQVSAEKAFFFHGKCKPGVSKQRLQLTPLLTLKVTMLWMLCLMFLENQLRSELRSLQTYEIKSHLFLNCLLIPDNKLSFLSLCYV